MLKGTGLDMPMAQKQCMTGAPIRDTLRHPDYAGEKRMSAQAVIEERILRARNSIEKCGIQIGESSREADELEALLKELPPLSVRAEEALYKLVWRTL